MNNYINTTENALQRGTIPGTSSKPTQIANYKEKRKLYTTSTRRSTIYLTCKEEKQKN